MCNLVRISAWIIAAEVAALVALALILIAMGNSANIFTAFLSVGLMIGASVSLAIAFTSLGAAMTQAAPCMTGRCQAAATAFFAVLGALTIAIGALLTAVVIGTWGTAIPIAGSLIAGGLAIGLLGQLVLWPSVGFLLEGLNRCVGTPPATTTIVAIAAVLAFVVALVAGFVFGKSPCSILPIC